MGDEGQPRHIAWRGPWRISLVDQVRKGDIAVAGGRRLGRRVMPFDPPLGQVLREEAHEVVLGLGRAGRARDARDQDGREQRAIVDVEIEAARWYPLEAVVREFLVG